jgi:uncharacterized membrane protein YdbT with pleckstrin-like domain
VRQNILPATFDLRSSHSDQFNPTFTMASVYNTVSKKQSRQQAEESEPDDVEMEDMLADADDTSESEEEEEEEAEDSSKKQQLSSGFMPKTRVLMLTSRGVTHRYVLFERTGESQFDR